MRQLKRVRDRLPIKVPAIPVVVVEQLFSDKSHTRKEIISRHQGSDSESGLISPLLFFLGAVVGLTQPYAIPRSMQRREGGGGGCDCIGRKRHVDKPNLARELCSPNHQIEL